MNGYVMADFRALLISPYHDLVDVAREVAPDYPELEVTVHEGNLSKGLAAALGSIDSDFDVVISRGGTAQMLEDELSLPVIEIDVSATDLLEALARHNPQGRRTAVIGFSNALRAVSEVADFSDFDLDVYGVSFEDELPIVLEDVASGDYEVILCDSFSRDACAERGMTAHLLSSGARSVSDALRRALDLCQQTREVRTQNHVLWQLIRSLPPRVALFSGSGRLVYTNLTERRPELLGYLREHLGGEKDEHLALQRGRRTYRISKSTFEQDGEAYLSFSIMTSSAPSNESLAGIERRNRDAVERSYHESVFHAVGAGEELSAQISGALRAGRPIALEGEVGTGKARIAELVYLTGPWASRPLVTIDCPLLTDRSWGYLMDSPNSPLYGSGETLWVKAVHALDDDAARRLVDVMRQTGICERDRVIVSANDSEDATEGSVISLFVEYLRCHVLTAPPLRRRRDLRRAIGLFLDSEARHAGTVPPLVTDEAMDLLLGHPWPRNYIELRQVLQRASATTEEGVMRARDVREALDREGATRFSSLDTPSETSSIDLLRPLREIERDIVRMVVEKYGGNQTEAARTLGVSRTTIWRILKDGPCA